MKLQLIENSNSLTSEKLSFEVHCASFRELYDVISWLGGCTKFYQHNDKSTTNYEYETYIRNNDRRKYPFDKQKETNSIEIQVMEDSYILIEL